jgi:DNA-binding MarR family transcriptional regulator
MIWPAGFVFAVLPQVVFLMSTAKPRASTRASRRKTPLVKETPLATVAGKTPSSSDTLEQVIAPAREFMTGMAPAQVQGEAISSASAIMCHIMLLNSVLERRANRFAEAHGLTLTQWMALGCIGNGGEEGLRHAELGQRLMLSKAPVTGMVDRLERDGYVQRRADRADRRASRIVITAQGLESWKNVRGALRENSQKLCEHMEQDEQNHLLRILARFLESAAEGDPILSMCGSRAK